MRSRFKAWRVDKKNKRKAKGDRTSNCKGTCGRRISDTSTNSTTPEHSPERSQDVAIGDSSEACTCSDEQRSSHGIFPRFSETLFHEFTEALFSSIITRVAPKKKSPKENSVKAMAHWYDHIASLDDQGLSSISQSERSSEVFDTLGDGLHYVGRHSHKGKELLLRQGAKLSAVLRLADPVTTVLLLQLLVLMQNFCEQYPDRVRYANILRDFLLRTAHHELGSTHPLTVLVNDLVHDRMSPDFCDTFFFDIISKYLGRLKDDKRAECKNYFSGIHGEILHSQGRFREVEDWFEAHITFRASAQNTGQSGNDLFAFCILADSRQQRGLYAEAEETLSQAMTSLHDSKSQYFYNACDVVESYAKLKEKTNELDRSEQLRQQSIQIAQARNDHIDFYRSVFDLWNFYRKQGRFDSAVELEEAHSEIFRK